MKKRDKDRSETYQNIKFYEDDQYLFFGFRWFTLSAFFLLFFCIAWDSFLIFWYSMAGGGGAPWIFFVFPLAHVAVGIGLTYYTCCLFVNKTFIIVDSETLKIRHSPLPWFGNKQLPAADIEQLYVKQKTVSSKNGTSYIYELRGILKNGDDIKLVSEREWGISSGAARAKMMERKIENFLGIPDYRVEGEYEANGKLSKDQVRRESKTILNPTHITLNDLKPGYILNYDNQTWETVYQTQYDWNHGESDFLYSLTNASHASILLYLQNRLGVCAIWREEKIDLFHLEAANLTKDGFTDLPSKIHFGKKDYLKQEICYGKQFVTDSRAGSPVEQCFFVRQDKTGSLRLLKRSQSALSGFAGTPARSYEFSNILPKYRLPDNDFWPG